MDMGGWTVVVLAPLLALLPAHLAARKGYPAWPFWLAGLPFLVLALAVALALPSRQPQLAAARLDRLRDVPLARALAEGVHDLDALARAHGQSQAATERLLRHLAEGGLAEEVAPGRWRGSDKLRGYAGVR